MPDPAALQTRVDDLARGLPGDLAGRVKAALTREIRAHLRETGNTAIETLTADVILTTDWPEPVWAIPRILPVGLAILAGRPKVGKSWLALQFAQAVAAGGIALGERVERGPILYLALEDPPRRLSERMKKQSWPPGLDADFMTLGNFADQVGDLRNGGSDVLARAIERRGYRLVVIDTLSRAISGDQGDVATMTLALTPLQEMAHSHNCAALLVDHHRKSGGFDLDAVSDVLGSTAKGAMADTIIGLYRERGKAGAKLTVTGRDIEERTLALTMDWLTACWQSEGDADQLALTTKRQELLETLAGLGRSTLNDLVDATGRNRGTLYRSLADLVGAGLVRKKSTSHGDVYWLPERERERENLSNQGN